MLLAPTFCHTPMVDLGLFRSQFFYANLYCMTGKMKLLTPILLLPVLAFILDWHVTAQEIPPRSCSESPVTQAEIQSIRDAIRAIINGNRDINFSAKFVRLGFHDCVGGCDGCIDLSDPDNAGLGIPIDALDDVVAQFENECLSRADMGIGCSRWRRKHTRGTRFSLGLGRSAELRCWRSQKWSLCSNAKCWHGRERIVELFQCYFWIR